MKIESWGDAFILFSVIIMFSCTAGLSIGAFAGCVKLAYSLISGG